jgi:AraC-like DNA-binding protein
VPYLTHRLRPSHRLDSRLLDASVDAFWSFEFDDAPHRVLPDGCMDIIFNLSAGRATVVGTMSRAEVIVAPAGERSFGVRFRPGRAALFVEGTAAELSDSRAPLGALVGGGAKLLEERVFSARTDEERALAVAEFVSDPRSRVRGKDARVDRATSLLEREVAPSISEVAREIGVSERQLERLFAERVGVRPKLFARVLRMQRAARLLSRRRVSGADLSALAGYADEAHLAREFRELCGAAPSRLARDVGFVQARADGAG